MLRALLGAALLASAVAQVQRVGRTSNSDLHTDTPFVGPKNAAGHHQAQWRTLPFNLDQQLIEVKLKCILLSLEKGPCGAAQHLSTKLELNWVMCGLATGKYIVWDKCVWCITLHTCRLLGGRDLRLKSLHSALSRVYITGSKAVYEAAGKNTCNETHTGL